MILKNREQFLNEDKFEKLFGGDKVECDLETALELPNYKKIIDLGFTDVSGPLLRKRMNFKFSFKMEIKSTDKFSKLFGAHTFTTEALEYCENYRNNIAKTSRNKELSDEQILKDSFNDDGFFKNSYQIYNTGDIRTIPTTGFEFTPYRLAHGNDASLITVAEWSAKFEELYEKLVKIKDKNKLV